MVQGISGRKKRYVSVTARMAKDGHMAEDGHARSLSIQWYDGVTYPADDVLSVRRASSRRAGDDGICYTVRIGDKTTLLYYEDLHWLVEEIVADDISA